MNKLFKSEKGWIFIDSLFGMLILTIAMLALIGAYIMSSKSNVSAKNYGQALAYAQEYAENHKIVNDTVFTPSESFIAESKGPNSMFTITPNLTVKPLDTLNTLIVPVQITVSWTEQSVSKQITITNYYYEKQGT